MKGAGPATGSYSLKIEGDVSESHVFQQRNVSESKIVTERERTNPPSHPSHSENEESPPNLCVTHATIDPPSVVSHVSISDSSVQKLSDNPSPVPPGTKLRPRRSSIISKVSSFFQRLKSLRGTQEKGRASPVIVQAATFNNPLVVAPGKSNKQARNGNKRGRCHPVRSVDGERRYPNGYRGRRGSMDPSLYAFTISSAADARSEHTSDGEHTRACCVLCGFKLL